MDCSKHFRDEVKRVGPPTKESLERLRRMEVDCAERKGPNSFYVTFHLQSPPNISWSHNVDRHLGLSHLDYEEYKSLIHPAWFPMHAAFGGAVYVEGMKMYKSQQKKFGVYINNVPLKNQNGSYDWFNQVSVPAAFDAEGHLTCYLNHYHRLCAFDLLVPTKPKLTIDDKWVSEVDDVLAPAANNALSFSLGNLLTPACLQLLQKYRQLAKNEKGIWIAPSKNEVCETIGATKAAINKANVRIIQSLRGAFPNSVTHDVAGFACFLNDIYGAP